MLKQNNKKAIESKSIYTQQFVKGSAIWEKC